MNNYKNIISVALFFLFGASLFSQTDTATIIKKYKDVDIIIVPYAPEMYINYEEVFFAKASSKTPNQINNFIRAKLDKAIVDEFNKYAKTNSMLSNITYNTNEDLLKIYHESSYFYDNLKKKHPYHTLFDTEKSKLDNDKRKAENGELYSPVNNNENKFLNVKHEDIGFIKKTLLNNKADILIFITQFEIKGDYSNPYEVGSMSYNRRIKIHYAIFNKSGKNIGGGYVFDLFNAELNDIDEIANTYFPKIAEKLLYLCANDI